MLFDLLNQTQDSAINLEEIEGELFHQLTALEVTISKEDKVLVDGVKIGKHGYRLEWSKESGFTLQIGQHDRFVHTLTCMQVDLKNELGSLAMNLSYDELVHQVHLKGEGVLTPVQVKDLLKEQPRHNLWNEPEAYKDKYASLSELLKAHLEQTKPISNHWARRASREHVNSLTTEATNGKNTRATNPLLTKYNRSNALLATGIVNKHA